MPKIQWTGLPAALRDHLFERLRERKITADDLYRLKEWRESEPESLVEVRLIQRLGVWQIAGASARPEESNESRELTDFSSTVTK
jgi:hypothetical protein